MVTVSLIEIEHKVTHSWNNNQNSEITILDTGFKLESLGASKRSKGLTKKPKYKDVSFLQPIIYD